MVVSGTVLSRLSGDHRVGNYIVNDPSTHTSFAIELKELRSRAAKATTGDNAKKLSHDQLLMWYYRAALCDYIEGHESDLEVKESDVYPIFKERCRLKGLSMSRPSSRAPSPSRYSEEAPDNGSASTEAGSLPSHLKYSVLNPKPVGSGYDDTAHLKFANQPDTRIQVTSGAAMSICDSYDFVDLNIASEFLIGGRGLKEARSSYGYIKKSSGQKSLVAVFKPTKHALNRTSVRRCLAICSGWVLNSFFATSPDLLRMNISELDEYPTNSLATAHGIPKEYPILYYCYNIGLEFMVQERPAATLALLAWRCKHYETLLGSAEEDKKFEIPPRHQQIAQAVTYLSMYANERQIDVDEFFEGVTQAAIPIATFLRGIPPQRGGGRIAAAKEFDTKYFSRIFGQL